MKSNRPESDIDLYADSVLQDPYPFYRQLRDQAPAVRLKPTGMYALTRFGDVRDALRNWQVFSSARGVAMNEEINQAIAGNTLGSDPPRHQHLRSILVRPLMPDAMREVTTLIETASETLVRRLVNKRHFNAATDLAPYLPLTVVSHLVGLPENAPIRAFVDALCDARCERRRHIIARRISCDCRIWLRESRRTKMAESGRLRCTA
jgi:cytochrome P450